MENEPLKRSVRPSKIAKKGGKATKARTAEEEARRREALKERLYQKLELERRAVQVVERLLEDSVAEDFLIDCAKFITADNYKDAIEERFIAKLCGYPICPNKLGKIPTQQFKISTRTNKVYDITERKCFCSNFCYKASKNFELQIPKTPLWLRQQDSPPEIALIKNGESGISGQEVEIAVRRLREEDIENPAPAHPEGPADPAPAHHSEGSDEEREQDFVSSVVSQRQGLRVHWGDLPKRPVEGERSGGRGERVGVDTPSENRLEAPDAETEPPPQRHGVAADHVSEGRPVEEATAKLSVCAIGDPAAEPAADPDVVVVGDPGSAQPSLKITQVGVSKRGAAGLRNLLQPGSIRQNLLENLRGMLREWRTGETMDFLRGPIRSPGPSLSEGKPEEEEEDEEELDEDDLVVEQADKGGFAAGWSQEVPSAPVPDYETLQMESERLNIRVREFCKGTWVLPEEPSPETGGAREATAAGHARRDPVLPLVDSRAQHLIQTRITVERLTKSLSTIVGPLSLTISDISSDLNNLVRTFRFTSTNIIHRTPEWTLLGMVLLHLLSGVSPLVREALGRPASVEHLGAILRELRLEREDLLSLVGLFTAAAH